MGPLRGNAAGLNAPPCCAAAGAASAAVPLPPLLLLLPLPLAWSATSGRGRHSNSPTAPLGLLPKLRESVPGPPFLGGFEGLKGTDGAAPSAGAWLRVA